MTYETYNKTVVVHDLSPEINPYDGLWFCDNVEAEWTGGRNYRFENVNDKKGLIKFLETGQRGRWDTIQTSGTN